MKRQMALLGIGAGLMYLLDPELGSIRRSVLRDKINGLLPKTADAINARAEEIGNKAHDFAAKADDKAADAINTGAEEIGNKVHELAARAQDKAAEVLSAHSANGSA